MMAKIRLSDGGFTLIPEGTHVFKVTAVKYKEDFGKLEVVMETKDGLKHTERFSLLSTDGSINQAALNAFSYFAKTLLNDFTLTEIDHEDLVGHFIEGEIEHQVVPSNRDPNKTVTFVHMGDKRPSTGWGDEEEVKPEPTAKKKVNLAALLDD